MAKVATYERVAARFGLSLYEYVARKSASVAGVTSLVIGVVSSIHTQSAVVFDSSGPMFERLPVVAEPVGAAGAGRCRDGRPTAPGWPAELLWACGGEARGGDAEDCGEPGEALI